VVKNEARKAKRNSRRGPPPVGTRERFQSGTCLGGLTNETVRSKGKTGTKGRAHKMQENGGWGGESQLRRFEKAGDEYEKERIWGKRSGGAVGKAKRR